MAEMILYQMQMRGGLWYRSFIQKMKKGKAAGPSGVPVEVIQICECEGLLAEVANSMMDGMSMPESWRKSVLIPLYKGKGDAKSCSNYRSVKLLEHGMKAVERVFEERLRKVIDVSEMQLGFMPGRGTNRWDLHHKATDEKVSSSQQGIVHGVCRLGKGI